MRTKSIWPVLLLPVFFVVHGYVEFYPIIPVSDAFLLCLIYLFVGIVLSSMGRLFVSSWDQAFLFGFFLLAIEFFFGVAQDGLRNLFPSRWINKYSVLLPLVVVIMVLIWKAVRSKIFQSDKFQFYVRVTLITLTMVDLGIFVFTSSVRENKNGSIRFTSDRKIPVDSLPDIYLIVADEYPGNASLQYAYNRSNDSFIEELTNRGFYIADQAKSNYNFTEFSVASLLNMDYLRKIEGRNASLHHLRYCFNTMRKNPLTPFLSSRGYQINNLSIFDLNEEPSPVQPYLLPGRTKPLTEQTLSRRIIRDIGYHFLTDIPWTRDLFALDELNLHNNQYLYNKTRKRIGQDHPQFTYTHLTMPHSPFYFDRSGRMRPKEEWASRDSATYFEYLAYTNNKLLGLVDSITQQSTKPVAILLIGDHGKRDHENPVPTDLHFQTLVGVLLPSRDYHYYYPTISHVNLLRATVNSIFGEKLPYLKDSTIFLRE